MAVKTIVDQVFVSSFPGKRVKIGEVWEYTHHIASDANGDVDFVASSLEKTKVADIYADLRFAKMFAEEAVKHEPGVVGLSVIAVKSIDTPITRATRRRFSAELFTGKKR